MNGRPNARAGRARWGMAAGLAAGVAAGVGMAPAPALAQGVLTQGETRSVSTGVPQRDTLIRLSRRITINLTDTRLEDVFRFVADYTGADIEPLWIDDRNPDGLDKDQIITLRADNISALAFIERVLEKTRSDPIAGLSTWQLTDSGTLEIGPKSRLNARRRVEIYDINDLLIVLPNYNDAPEIDLQQAIQSGQGGGGGQSPFQDEDEETDENRRTKDERAQDIVDLILALVEPEQWEEAGGTGGSIRYYQGHLIVNAADYMHRQINGYRYWPARATTARLVNGRRWVSLNMDAGISALEGFGQQPVSAVVGGQIRRSDDPPGGG